MKKIKILGFAGSLRLNSYNLKLLNLFQSILGDQVEMEIFPLSEIPLYNADLEEAHFPPQIEMFKEKIRSADGIIISSPEYNYSVPGVLKNAIDWVSRPPKNIPFENKPGIIMSASTSRFGGARSQQHLRQILSAVGMLLMPQPELYIPKADRLFDSNHPMDDASIERIRKFAHLALAFIQKQDRSC